MTGEIDLSNAAQLRQHISTCLVNGASDLTVDMTGLEFIDCAGISALAVATQGLNGHGRLAVRNPPRSARTIMEVTGMIDAVTIEIEPPNPGAHDEC